MMLEVKRHFVILGYRQTSTSLQSIYIEQMKNKACCFHLKGGFFFYSVLS